MNNKVFGLYPDKKIGGKLYRMYGVFMEYEVKQANRLVNQIPGAIRRKEGSHQIVYILVKKHKLKSRRSIKSEIDLENLRGPLSSFIKK